MSGLRHQVNIAWGGVPGPVSGASALVGIRVPFACDPVYCNHCYIYTKHRNNVLNPKQSELNSNGHSGMTEWDGIALNRNWYEVSLFMDNVILAVMARSHCTEPGTAAGPGMGIGTMGFYIMLYCPHWSETGTGTWPIVSYCAGPGPIPGSPSVQCEWAIRPTRNSIKGKASHWLFFTSISTYQGYMKSLASISTR